MASFVAFASAADVCCEKTVNGQWCQLEAQTNCNSSWSIAQTSCDQTTFCQKGTCVNEQDGTCTPNVPKGDCENQGGTWSLGDKEDIPSCKVGCCIAGEEVAFVNPATCEQIGSDNGVNVNFRGDITSLEQCLTLSTGTKKGACVLPEQNSTSSGNFFTNLLGGSPTGETPSRLQNCKMTTQSDCISQGGSFNEGLLCTAQGLSNCAKSKNTKCVDEKVYFLDTCGNLANVYDSNMYSDSDSGWNANMINYWTNIQDPTCTVQNGGSSTCGDCDYVTGTICSKYHSGDEGMPSNPPAFGDNVCRDLSCHYDTNHNGHIDAGEVYKQGESWCAETPGTYPHVPVIMNSTVKNELRNSSKYNLPGSRYIKLMCYDGEVIQEECKDYRNSICKESKDSAGITHAQCIANGAALCFQIDNKTGCEAKDDCKWIEGYRQDRTKVSIKEGIDAINEKQGACYPLFSPGIPFWTEKGQQVCASNDVPVFTTYETGVFLDRDHFSDAKTEDLAHKCFDGCYAIPGYGSGNNNDILKIFQLTSTDGSKVNNDYISRREGYYCLKKSDKNDSISNLKTGAEVTGNGIDCSAGVSAGGKNSDADLNRRRVEPAYTNAAWLAMIRDRTLSTGDCGYKPSAFFSITNYSGDPNSEIITATFQKLSQKMGVKENITDTETIYKGDSYLPGVIKK